MVSLVVCMLLRIQGCHAAVCIAQVLKVEVSRSEAGCIPVTDYVVYHDLSCHVESMLSAYVKLSR